MSLRYGARPVSPNPNPQQYAALLPVIDQLLRTENIDITESQITDDVTYYNKAFEKLRTNTPMYENLRLKECSDALLELLQIDSSSDINAAVSRCIRGALSIIVRAPMSADQAIVSMRQIAVKYTRSGAFFVRLMLNAFADILHRGNGI